MLHYLRFSLLPLILLISCAKSEREQFLSTARDVTEEQVEKYNLTRPEIIESYINRTQRDFDGDGEVSSEEEREFNIDIERKERWKNNSWPDAEEYNLFYVTAQSTVKKGESFAVNVVPMDDDGLIFRKFTGTVIFKSEPVSVSGLPEEYKFTIEDNGSHRFENLSVSEDGICHITVMDKNDNSICGKSNPIEIYSDDRKLKIFWGDIHTHSLISDGQHIPDVHYKYARDIANLDFYALADHGVCVESQIDEWGMIQDYADKYYEPGRFVTFYGYEATQRKERGGHINVYFNEPDPPFISEYSNNSNDFFKKLAGHNVFMIPHHIVREGVGQNWEYYGREKIEPLCEIYSEWGSGEEPYYEKKWRSLDDETKKRGQSYQDALAKGYKLGVTGGSDNHHGDIGNPYKKGNSRQLKYRPGITGVFTEELTRDSVFNAHKKRHTYATTCSRIILYFDADGRMMGEEYTTRKNPELHIKVIGADEIERVEIVKNNVVVYTNREPGPVVSYSYIDNNFTDDSYYYVRVIQKDDNRAWSSPIWINK